ncbi:Fucose 4-O-acetylase [Selenomonas sp. GACV-9]|uniref:acyltransferase family protein n=1 Tax=Selenomonas sp. GACV-9 TaxID=3158782 RepID=UPI0008F29E7C|nr:Fucose 4-O-acetylase [Selenomonas ruminantium]
MNEKKRIEYIDIFRGIGIVFMVMGHIGFGVPFNKFIYAFHMPMFFFISGMFYREIQNEYPNPIKGIKTYIVRKAKTLLMPYMVFGIFHYIVYLVVVDSYDVYSPLKHLLFMNTDGLPIAVALWFLTALFGCEMIYQFIMCSVANKMMRDIIVFAIALFGCMFHKMTSLSLPWALEAACVGVGLFHFGKLAMMHSKKMLQLKVKTIIFMAVTVTLMIFVNNTINMRMSAYEIIPLFWLNAIGATIVGLNIARLWLEMGWDKAKLFNEHLCFIARNAIVYVCLNHLVIRICRMFLGNAVRSGYMRDSIICILSMGVLYVLCIAFMKSRLRVLWGR